MVPPCVQLPHIAPTQDDSRWVSGQRPLEGLDGDGVLEVLALIEVVTLGVQQVPVEGEVVPLDLGDIFSFTNIDLLQACSHHVPGRSKGHIRQGSVGESTVYRVPEGATSTYSPSRAQFCSARFASSPLCSPRIPCRWRSPQPQLWAPPYLGREMCRGGTAGRTCRADAASFSRCLNVP